MNSVKNPWKTHKSQLIYENKWIALDEHIVTTPGGSEGIYAVVSFKNLAIGVIPLDEFGNTWIVGQYRYPLNQYSWEIPEGGGDPAVSPELSALRELKEETGLVAGEIQPILEMHLSNSATNERAIIFLARQLIQDNPEPEDTEDLQVRKLPFDELYTMVCDGTVTDSLTVAGVLKIKLMMTEGLL